MGELGAASSDSTLVYNASVNATKAEVTDNANSLVYGVILLNTTAAVAYLQVFDLDADNVTVGTTAPTYTLPVTANGNQHYTFSKPIRHTTGFTIASTTTRDGNTGAAQEVTITYTSA